MEPKPFNYHTLQVQALMERSAPTKKLKTIPQLITIKSGIMNALNESLSKCRIDGNVVYLPPPHEYVMPNYSDVRKALLNAGATYKRNTFIFPNDAQPYIDRITGGEKVNIKKEFQFFATPPGLADEIVEAAEIEIYHSILEPSAGQGALVDAVCRKHPARVHHSKVGCIELMDINRLVLSQKDNLILFESDFLKVDAALYRCDRIIANPPFNKNQDIAHIHKMYDCLNAGGRIVTIASKHWQFSSGRKEKAFKAWLDYVGAQVSDIEAGEFEESGTKIATCMIIINKPF